VVGGGMFGFFPATAAMFSVSRKWVIGERDIPIIKAFWGYFKKDFIQTNILGYVLIFIGIFLYFDLKISLKSDLLFFRFLTFTFLIFFILYFVILLYVFPIHAHYKFRVLEYIKYSLIMALAKPLQTIMMVVSFLAIVLIIRFSPILVLFLAGGLISITLTSVSMRSFLK
jgi:uncharacterized membrane protein YesL